ncbi:hypothetical protein OY671_011656, partial [Metschnikowia pulcherrima]
LVDTEQEKAALGDSLIASREITLTPGQRFENVEKVPKGATYIAVAALFYAPAPQRWKYVFEVKSVEDSGIVSGDPINGKFFVARSFDGGDSWHEIPTRELPEADSGEACFASSGTNVRKLKKDEACFISGGLRSRSFIRDQRIDSPIVQGRESTGANSIA